MNSQYRIYIKTMQTLLVLKKILFHYKGKSLNCLLVSVKENILLLI